MTIRLFGALLCGAALLLATPINLAQAQSGIFTGRVTNAQGQPETTGARKNPGQGNFVGTSRGVIVTPYQIGGSHEQRRRSNTSDRMGGGGGKGTPRLKVEFQDITITGYRTKNGGMGGPSRGDKRDYPYGKQQHR